MNGVLPAPAVKGRETEHVGEVSQEFICPWGLEKRAVRAIVKYDEDAHQEPAA
jgi:hypothetical protein